MVQRSDEAQHHCHVSTSFGEIPPGMSKAPLLRPVAMEPHRWSNASVPLAFLNTIERIEINRTRVRDGVTYYVLDVYLYHLNTRLPTQFSNPRHAVEKSNVDTRKQTRTAATRPDYQVERRFSEFCRLRAQVYELASMNPHYFCAHCKEIMAYVRFQPRQPHMLTKIATGSKARKAILSTFINDFLRMALHKEIQNRNCAPEDLVPYILKLFLRGRESEEDFIRSTRLTWL
uniref:PX domain-containing protein n=1 Tax=Globisporangium ultimum (strain ATCC 200006 / CBS 805.95 / DAOM BR144) TaxID=431595 RepID=K3WE21_GLOUD